MVTAMKRLQGSAGRGGLSVLPARRTVLIALAVCGWLGLQLALVGWWATVIGRQARRIARSRRCAAPTAPRPNGHARV